MRYLKKFVHSKLAIRLATISIAREPEFRKHYENFMRDLKYHCIYQEWRTNGTSRVLWRHAIDHKVHYKVLRTNASKLEKRY